MKFLLLALSAALFTTGCTQPKNRLTDDKNTEYQEKLAKANKANQAPQKHSVDVPTPGGAKPTKIDEPTVEKKEIDEDLVKPARSGQVVEEKIQAPVQSCEANPVSTPPTPVVTAQAPELKPEEKKVDTVASREQAQKDIAKAVDTKTENKPDSPKAKEATDAYKVSLVELRSILSQVYKLVENQQAALQSIQDYNSEGSGISSDKLSFDLDLKEENSNISVIYDNQVIAKFENLKIKYNEPSVKTSNGISLLSVCATESCDLLMLTFRKATTEKLLFNLPLFLKTVDDKVIRTSLKTSEEYSKEAKDAAAAAPATAQAARPEVQPLDLSEYSSVLEQITRTKVVNSDEELKRITTLYVSPSLKMDAKKIITGIGSKDDGLIFSIGYEDQVLTRATKVKLKFGEAFKSKTEEGYNFNAVCGNDKCSVILVVFTKIEDNKTIFNAPLYFRVINDKIVPVNIKSDEAYKAEAREKLKSEVKK